MNCVYMKSTAGQGDDYFSVLSSLKHRGRYKMMYKLYKRLYIMKIQVDTEHKRLYRGHANTDTYTDMQRYRDRRYNEGEDDAYRKDAVTDDKNRAKTIIKEKTHKTRGQKTMLREKIYEQRGRRRCAEIIYRKRRYR